MSITITPKNDTIRPKIFITESLTFRNIEAAIGVISGIIAMMAEPMIGTKMIKLSQSHGIQTIHRQIIRVIQMITITAITKMIKLSQSYGKKKKTIHRQISQNAITMIAPRQLAPNQVNAKNAELS